MTDTHLGALIDQQSKLNDLSYSQIAARAQQRGHKLTKSNVGRVYKGPNPAMSQATILALAAGLGVTPTTVARAVLADMGIVLAESDTDAETAIRTDPTLPDTGRRMLLAMLGEIRAQTSTPQAARSSVDEWAFGTPSDEDIAIARADAEANP